MSDALEAISFGTPRWSVGTWTDDDPLFVNVKLSFKTPYPRVVTIYESFSDTLAKPEGLVAAWARAGADPMARNNEIATTRNTLRIKGLHSHR